MIKKIPHLMFLPLLTALGLTGCFKSAADNVTPSAYPVAAQASHGGTISPQSLNVETGKTASFTVAPNPGFTIDRVTGCKGELIGDIFSTGPVTEKCTVVAEFINATGETYQVSARAASGTTRGDITPSRITVGQDYRAILYITHDVGYVPVISGCPGTLEGQIYTTTPVNTDCEVEVVFEPISGDLQLITALSGYGGTIAPDTLSVPTGEAASFMVSPGRGYSAQVTGCNGTLTDNVYTIEAVTDDCVVDAQFTNDVPDSHRITATIEEGGTISPTHVSLQDGGIVSFNIETEIDRAVVDIVGCPGNYSEAAGLFITSPINADCDVRVILGPSTPPSHPIGVNVRGFGQATPELLQVQDGSRAQITLEPFLGYRVDHASGCNGQLNGTVYTTGIIRGPCLIDVLFVDNLQPTLEVTSSSGPNGSISPSAIHVASGSRTGFTATADDGYAVQSITGCSGTRDGDTYKTGSITEACNVHATFQRVYTITTAISGGGSIAPQEMKVTPGGSAVFTVSRGDDQRVESIGSTCNAWSWGGVYDEKMYINNVQGDCHIYAVISGKPIISGRVNGLGTISPESAIMDWNEQRDFVITPAEGWHLYSVDGCFGWLLENPADPDSYIYRATNLGFSCEFIATFHEDQEPPPLPAPTNIWVMAGDSTGRITYSFDPVEGATGYNLYMKIDGPPTLTDYTLRSTDVEISADVFNIPAGTHLFFMATAYFGDDPDSMESGPSEIVSAFAPY